ncbi:Rox3-domain-containing protein [Aureobasidium pullulans]|nr:Rox3-domain-containing protein [Aureobasidium pullulans]
MDRHDDAASRPVVPSLSRKSWRIPIGRGFLLGQGAHGSLVSEIVRHIDSHDAPLPRHPHARIYGSAGRTHTNRPTSKQRRRQSPSFDHRPASTSTSIVASSPSPSHRPPPATSPIDSPVARMPTSPASPPYYYQNQPVIHKAAPVSVAPHTPPSPASVRMSSSAHNGKDQSFPTPPSSYVPTSSHSFADMNTHNSTPQHSMDTDMPDAEAPQARPTLPLLCQSPHPISRPHPNENLINLYGLQSIANSVRRTDPITGEKINKLRKSYEGKVKNFGLTGKNKPTDLNEELRGLLQWDPESWYDQRVHGRELDKAESSPLMATLGRALTMNPGTLPADEHNKWKSILGLDDGNKTPSQPASKIPAHSQMLKAQASSMRASAPASPRASNPNGIRPDRSNKKRRYDESSYTGYNESYQEDDGYSTGGLDDKRNSATKKRRKEFPTNFDASGGSSAFNNGMLGVGVKSS